MSRDIRRVHLPLGGLAPFGALAGTTEAHPFAPDGSTGTTCCLCFSVRDDCRHAAFDSLPPQEPPADGGVRMYGRSQPLKRTPGGRR